MKSTEFLTEAESNLAVKKLDKYLDMLSNDNLRGLIPLVRKSLSMNEADDKPTQYFGRLAPDARQASKPVSSPTLTAPTLNKGSEEAKITQVISGLSEEEKKELLSLLQKEAKTRPAKEPAKKKSADKPQNKKDKKGSGVLTGCLLPLVGIVGLMAAIGANVEPETNKNLGTNQPSASNGPKATYSTDNVDDRPITAYQTFPTPMVNVPPSENLPKSTKDVSFFKAISGEYLDRAKQRFCQIRSGWTTSDVLNYMEAEDVDFNDMFLEKELLSPDTEIWRYGAMNQIGTLYIDRDSNKVTSVIFGDISPDDC